MRLIVAKTGKAGKGTAAVAVTPTGLSVFA